MRFSSKKLNELRKFERKKFSSLNEQIIRKRNSEMLKIFNEIILPLLQEKSRLTLNFIEEEYENEKAYFVNSTQKALLRIQLGFNFAPEIMLRKTAEILKFSETYKKLGKDQLSKDWKDILHIYKKKRKSRKRRKKKK